MPFFFNLDCETIGTAATPGLLCQPRVIMMIMESIMECRLAGETEVLGENLPQRHFCPSQNPTCPPGFEPGPPRKTCPYYDNYLLGPHTLSLLDGEKWQTIYFMRRNKMFRPSCSSYSVFTSFWMRRLKNFEWRQVLGEQREQHVQDLRCVRSEFRP
jgi:hypothetical protein